MKEVDIVNGVNEMLEVEIQGKGHTNKNWSNHFGGLAVKHRENGNSTFSSPVLDQPELRDALSSLADLSLDLISVETEYGTLILRLNTDISPTPGGKGSETGN